MNIAKSSVKKVFSAVTALMLIGSVQAFAGPNNVVITGEVVGLTNDLLGPNETYYDCAGSGTPSNWYYYVDCSSEVTLELDWSNGWKLPGADLEVVSQGAFLDVASGTGNYTYVGYGYALDSNGDFVYASVDPPSDNVMTFTLGTHSSYVIQEEKVETGETTGMFGAFPVAYFTDGFFGGLDIDWWWMDGDGTPIAGLSDGFLYATGGGYIELENELDWKGVSIKLHIPAYGDYGADYDVDGLDLAQYSNQANLQYVAANFGVPYDQI